MQHHTSLWDRHPGRVSQTGTLGESSPDMSPTFFVSALGRVPKWGSAALSTGLLMSEGTDSVLRSLGTV